MIISYVMTMLTISESPYLWVFYKFLDMAKKHNWPIIAQEEYFQLPSVFKEKGLRIAYDQEFINARFFYEVPQDEDLNNIQKYSIPSVWEQQLIKEKGSITDAFNYLLGNRCESLEKMLNEYLDDIVSKNEEPIEAIMTLCHYPSLSFVAEQRGIKVIHLEMGPFREPTYKKTAYFDFNSLFHNPSSESRYENFLTEHQQSPLDLLDSKEILALLLDEQKMHILDQFDKKPTHEMGVATGYAIWPLLMHQSLINDQELIYRIKKQYTSDKILLRKHPGDPWKADYAMEVKSRDVSRTPLEFVLKCERVATLISNVAIEAMVCGKTVYTLCKCPISFKAKKNLEDRAISPIEKEFVNFFVFSYLIPFQCITDVEYIRWRLTEPTETEIYYRHLEFYLKQKNIPLDILELKSGRYDALIKCLQTTSKPEMRTEQKKVATQVDNATIKKAESTISASELVLPEEIPFKVLLQLLKRKVKNKIIKNQ